MVNKTLHRKLTMGQEANDGIRNSGVDSGAPEWQAVPAPLVA
jgi:hypothetical protein